MRFFTRRVQEEQERGPAKLAAIGTVVGLTPVFAFWLDWRLGLFIVGAYTALGFGVWMVSKQP